MKGSIPTVWTNSIQVSKKKARDGCYMNARYGGFPQGTVVD